MWELNNIRQTLPKIQREIKGINQNLIGIVPERVTIVSRPRRALNKQFQDNFSDPTTTIRRYSIVSHYIYFISILLILHLTQNRFLTALALYHARDSIKESKGY